MCATGKRKREEEGSEGEEKRKRTKEDEKEKKGFECGICFELMGWEKEPRILPCCSLSFCSS